MLNKHVVFSNAISVEWVDRETLRYSEDGYSVLVWVDYDSGLFNNTRIIKLSSIVLWEKRPGNTPEVIESGQKEKIIEYIQRYFSLQNKVCRVEV